MPIILDLTEEEYNNLLTKSAAIEELDARLEAMKPFSEYKYLEEIVDNSEYTTRIAALETELADTKKKYIDRFFSGTGLESKKEEEKEQEDKKHETKPEIEVTFEDLYGEV